MFLLLEPSIDSISRQVLSNRPDEVEEPPADSVLGQLFAQLEDHDDVV